MAGDWIKMRTDLYRDPKVSAMADILMSQDGELAAFVSQNCQRDMTVTRNVMRNVTVGALVAVWGVTRHRGKRIGDDLIVRGVTLAVVDDIADLPGFGDAMKAVGWAEQNDVGVVFPRFFEEFNVEPGAESKQKNAARQKRYREKIRNALRDVTVTSESDARIEKRREEKKEDKDSSAKSRPAPKTPRPTPDTPHHKAIEFYGLIWQKRYGTAYAWRAIDFSGVKSILEALGKDLEKFKAVSSRFLADPDPFYAGHCIKDLLAKLPRWLTDAPRQPRPSSKAEAQDAYLAEQMESVFGGST